MSHRHLRPAFPYRPPLRSLDFAPDDVDGEAKPDWIGAGVRRLEGRVDNLSKLSPVFIRRILVAVAFAIAAVSAWVPNYGRAVTDRAALRKDVDPFAPEYRRFLKVLRNKATPGETVLVVLDQPNAPPYFLAINALAGRRVIPANAKTGKAMDRAGEADLVAVWPDTLVIPASFREVERFHGGVIARR